jgi:hypothetical protein
MPLPLPIAPAPSALELYLPRLHALYPREAAASAAAISACGWTLPLALLQPLAPLFGRDEVTVPENFLAGLQAASVLGVGALPASGPRRTPLAWVGVELREDGRFFNNLRGGCWVCGFPAVGRGRELLRVGNMAEVEGLRAALGELGQIGPSGARLYFSFHYDLPEAGCERLYVLDPAASRLDGFAFPSSALAPAKLK